MAFKFAAGQMPRRYGSARPHTATQGRPLLVMLNADDRESYSGYVLSCESYSGYVPSWVLALHDDDALSEDERNELPSVT